MAETPVYLIPPSEYGKLASLFFPQITTAVYFIRSLQWQHTSPTSSIYATFPLTNTTLPRTFCVARIDRAGPPGLNLYIHSSLERPPPSHAQPLSPSETDLAIRQLFATLATLHRTAGSTTPISKEAAPTDPVFAGHLHTTTAHLLSTGLDPVIPPSSLALPSHPYNKYIFSYRPTGTLPTLPSYLEYSTITPKDYALVMQENALVRNASVLAGCETAAIRFVGGVDASSDGGVLPETTTQPGEMVAWVFMTGYGSVRSLHTQPAWRQKGLARKVVQLLLERSWPTEFENMDENGEEDQAHVFHVDIDAKNEASIRTFAVLGQQLRMEECYWVNCDLAKAEGALQALDIPAVS